MARIVKVTNGADCRFLDLDDKYDAKQLKKLTAEFTGYKVVKDAVTKEIKQYSKAFVDNELAENKRIHGELEDDLMARLAAPAEEFYE